MRIIFDCRTHTLYPIGSEGFTSGTVVMVRNIAEGLASRGHTVHVITADLPCEEQHGANLWYWGPNHHPLKCEAVVMLMQVDANSYIDADKVILMTFGCDPGLGPDHSFASGVDAFPLLSDTHGQLMRISRPTIKEEQCFVTGLGVNLFDYSIDEDGLIAAQSTRDWLNEWKVPGRMLYANDPARGLPATLDIFDLVKKQVPEATLHVAYDFDRNLDVVKWGHHYMAQMLLDCKRRMESTPGVVNRGKLTRQEIIQEQLACQVHCMPSDPANHDQIHGLTQMECGAAGAALVLSDVDAFPEVFGDGAIILPVVGQYVPGLERRVSAVDYATVVSELMLNPERWSIASQSARKLAEANTWDAVIDKWEVMMKEVGL